MAFQTNSNKENLFPFPNPGITQRNKPPFFYIAEEACASCMDEEITKKLETPEDLATFTVKLPVPMQTPDGCVYQEILIGPIILTLMKRLGVFDK